MGEPHSLECDGHQQNQDNGDNGQAAEQGLEETKLHVIQEEVYGECAEDAPTAYPDYEGNRLSRGPDFLMAMIALDGAIFPFQDIAGTLADGYSLMAIGALSGFHGLAFYAKIAKNMRTRAESPGK